MKYKLGLIGAGNMAEAVAKAAIEQGLVTADKIIASDTNPERRDLFASLGINVTEDNDLIVTEARQIRSLRSSRRSSPMSLACLVKLMLNVRSSSPSWQASPPPKSKNWQVNRCV